MRDSFVAIGNLDLQEHHEFLKLRRHAILAVPILVGLENFLHEMKSQLDVLETQDYQFVNALTRT